jgi:hypothetical protein
MPLLRTRWARLVACTAVLALVSCGSDTQRVTITSRTVLPATTTTRARPPTTTAAPTTTSTAMSTTTTTMRPTPPTIARWVPPASLEPCGGDLPTCAIVARESGGSYTAVNPTGCDGHGCFGKYQFSGAWACKLGLPCDIAHATPAQQDAAARLLWNHGAGCSNWSC